MNGRFEEKLAQLAFGDLSPEEAARVEAQASKDAEAMRTLATYRDMQSGLKDLTAIPDDQFSKDRLRTAILAQGLKPTGEEKASRWGWTWMPVTACLLAVGLMTLSGRFGKSDVEPVVAINDPTLSRSDMLALKEPWTIYDFSKEVKPDITPVAAKAEPEPKLAVRTVRPAPEPIPDEYVPIEEGVLHKKEELIAGNTKIPTTTESPVIDDSGGGEAMMTTPAPPIVIIEENRDESTGAFRATEVGTASNVLIGG